MVVMVVLRNGLTPLFGATTGPTGPVAGPPTPEPTVTPEPWQEMLRFTGNDTIDTLLIAGLLLVFSMALFGAMGSGD